MGDYAAAWTRWFRAGPGIVVPGTAHNEVFNTVVVVPTSSSAPEIWPLRLAVGSFAGKNSYAVIPSIRQVRKGRLQGALGQFSHEQLVLLDECLEASLRQAEVSPGGKISRVGSIRVHRNVPITSSATMGTKGAL